MDAQAGEAPSTGALASSPAAGGALYAALTACSALRVAGLAGGKAGRGRRVLLLGLGGVGHLALQLLTRRGFDTVVGCAGELAERARAAGATGVLDRHAPDYVEQLAASGPYVSQLRPSLAFAFERGLTRESCAQVRGDSRLRGPRRVGG